MNRTQSSPSTSVTVVREHSSIALIVCALLAVLTLCGRQNVYSGTARHVVASGGLTTGTAADSAHGWTLAWSLSSSNTTLVPGDTVWIHAGTYNGTFTATKSGTSGSPIIYRVRPGQRATIDAGSPYTAQATLGINAAYVWVWGLEIMSSATTKAGGDETYGNYSWPDNIAQPEGVVFLPTDGSVDIPGVKIIRCIVHDTKQGISHWKGGRYSEVTDCVFYDGWYDTNGDAHGHNWYIQTQPMNGTVKFINNVNERSYDNAFQVYGSATTYGDSVYVDNNIFSQCGSNVGIGNGRNGFFGPGNLGYDDFFRGNVSYTDMSINLLVCSGNGTPGTDRFTMTGNLLWGQGSTLTFQFNTSPTITANKIFYGGGAPESSLPGNTWTTSKPSTWDTTIIHPFTYEKGANIVVLNSAGASTRSVNFSGFLSAGDTYTVIDAQNYYGTPIASGTYTGGTVSIPLTGKSLPAVIGNDPRQYHHTSSEFNVFVVVSGSYAPCQAPSSVTASACNITATGSELDGSLDPNGLSTTYHFDYGLTSGYGSSTSTANAGTGSAPVVVSTDLSGLTPATLYHYRIVASNSGGTTTSCDMTLTTSSSPLPIQLASFRATPAGTAGPVELTWTTASEVNNFGFYIQRSASPTSGFADVPGGFVAGSGTSLIARSYTWVDRNPLAGTSYYLLKQVDLDGNARLSDPVKVVVGAADGRGAAVFALGQNYPNPFNPSTHITFSVDNAAYTTLKVYNILGEVVSTPFEGMAQSGREYDVAFDGSSLSSGAYFYRLVNGNHTELKRMVVVK